MRGQCHSLAALYPRERPSTHCTRGWVGPRASLDRYGKSHPPPGFDPGPSSPQPVAIPTKLPGPWRYREHTVFMAGSIIHLRCTGNVTFWFLTQPYSTSYQYMCISLSLTQVLTHRVLLKQPACPPHWQLLRIKKPSWATQILRMPRRRSLTFLQITFRYLLNSILNNVMIFKCKNVCYTIQYEKKHVSSLRICWNTQKCKFLYLIKLSL